MMLSQVLCVFGLALTFFVFEALGLYFVYPQVIQATDMVVLKIMIIIKIVEKVCDRTQCDSL